jgi:anti-anti-sigma factor
MMLKPSVEIHDAGGVMVAEFWECLRLDPAPVGELRSHYDAHLKRGGRPDLVVDLSGVGFSGSAALGNLVAVQRDVRSHGGRILICNVDPTVAEVFRASKLESLFEFVTDRSAAIRAIADGLPAGRGARDDGADGALANDKPPRPGRSGGGPLSLRRRQRGPESA